MGEVEDEYEYAVRKTRKDGATDDRLALIWTTLEKAKDDLDLFAGRSKVYNYKLVKRRKAGKIEDA